MTEEKEQKAQRLYMEFQELDQHIKQVQKQIEMISSQLMEATVTRNSLEEFGKIETGKEIFVPVSSGIFAKAEIKSNSELLINIGANVVVQKNLDGAKKLIQGQIEEIKSAQKRIIEEYEKMTDKAAEMQSQLQAMLE